MHPLLLKADFDPFQMAIIVIAVFAGFVKWLWENWQQKSSQAPPPPVDPEEQRLREAAWRKQTGQAAAPPPLPPVAAPSAWDELRKAWKELQDTVKQPTATRTPPPVPAQRRSAVRREPPLPPQPQRQPQVSRSAAATVPAAQKPLPPPAPVPAASPPFVAAPKTTAPAGSALASLLHLRRDPALMRQAILMQEILGPPKALQSSTDLAI